MLHVPRDIYRSLFDNMADGLAYCKMIFDASGNPVDFVYIKANKNFEKMTGQKEVAGKKVTEMIPGIGISNPELFEIYGKVSLSGVTKRFEIYVAALPGWFLISVYSPRKKHFVIVLQNITDRKEIESNLEDARIAARNVLEDLEIEKSKVEMAQAKEEAILLSIGDGLIATDGEGNIMLVNKAAEHLLGVKSHEIMGKPFSEAVMIEDEKGMPIPPDKHPVTLALSAAVSPTFIPLAPANYHMWKGMARFPAAIMATPVIFEGNVIGSIEVFRNIAREKEVDRAKSEFVALASHQLRTPLTTISWYTEMILRGDVGEVSPEQKKYLEEVYQGNVRMIELVNTLLDVSRIELGTFKIEPEMTDVLALAKSVLGEQEPKIEQKRFMIVQRFGKDVPPLSADPKLLRIVLQNIFTNALEYTPPGGKIEFEVTFENKKAIHIKISDTGYGIPKGQQDQIFSKLFRADNVRDKDTDGTGLGLYIAKSIVENSGGKIWFESEESKGTAFHITLPLAGLKNKLIDINQ